MVLCSTDNDYYGAHVQLQISRVKTYSTADHECRTYKTPGASGHLVRFRVGNQSLSTGKVYSYSSWTPWLHG